MVNFWSRDFLGFVGSPRYFLGFSLPPFDHPCHLKSRVTALGISGHNIKTAVH